VLAAFSLPGALKRLGSVAVLLNGDGAPLAGKEFPAVIRPWGNLPGEDAGPPGVGRGWRYILYGPPEEGIRENALIELGGERYRVLGAEQRRLAAKPLYTRAILEKEGLGI
jgi:hypothetical protein